MEMVPPQIVAAGAAGPSPPRNMWCVLAEGSNAVGRRAAGRREIVAPGLDEDAQKRCSPRVKTVGVLYSLYI